MPLQAALPLLLPGCPMARLVKEQSSAAVTERTIFFSFSMGEVIAQNGSFCKYGGKLLIFDGSL